MKKPFKKFIFTLLRFYSLIFARPLFYNFHMFLFEFSLRGLGILNFQDAKVSGELFFVRLLRKKMDVKVVFDVGAHVGQYSEMFRYSKSHVYSFEPLPENYKILEERFKDFKNFHLFPFGLSDKSRDSKFYFGKKSKVSPTLHEKVINDIFEENIDSINIKLSTIDKIVSKYNISRINFLKIDTEGHELAVLKGAKNVIDQGKLDIILFEFNEMNTISRVFFKDFVMYLEKYKLFRLLPKGLVEIKYKGHRVHKLEIFAYQNIVAIRKDLLSTFGL